MFSLRLEKKQLDPLGGHLDQTVIRCININAESQKTVFIEDSQLLIRTELKFRQPLKGNQSLHVRHMTILDQEKQIYSHLQCVIKLTTVVEDDISYVNNDSTYYYFSLFASILGNF